MKILITREMLADKKACTSGLAIFDALYPTGEAEIEWGAEEFCAMARMKGAYCLELRWCWEVGILPTPSLRDADLRGADFFGASLRGVDFTGADLRSADLEYADLAGAVLRNAGLREADLQDASLRGADLRGANLRDAVLRGADLSGAILKK